MNSNKIFISEWIEIHPYDDLQESDTFFVNLCNKLYNVISIKAIPTEVRKRCALYVSAYLEDIISGLGLWHAFIKGHKNLYSKPIPFYKTNKDYIQDEINVEDIQFILWYTIYKAECTTFPPNPMSEEIKDCAEKMFLILNKIYDTAPENKFLKYYLYDFKDIEEAEKKIEWLFRSSYLIQPSTSGYSISNEEKFIFPCGPLALFLYEWMEILSENNYKKWMEIKNIVPPSYKIPQETLIKNSHTYELFLKGTNGKEIVYLKGYDALHDFLTNVLKWPDNNSHTLPQMKEFNDFILMVNQERGILLAHDIAKLIKDPLNPLYDKETARNNDYSLLTEPRLCPPDLLKYVINNNYIPEARFPKYGEKEIVRENSDFIARCSLLYFYRGD